MELRRCCTVVAAAPASNSHLHANKSPFWQAIIMGVAPSTPTLVVLRPRPPRTAAHPTGGHSGGRCTWSDAFNRLGDVCGRAHLEQPRDRGLPQAIRWE